MNPFENRTTAIVGAALAFGVIMVVVLIGLSPDEVTPARDDGDAEMTIQAPVTTANGSDSPVVLTEDFGSLTPASGEISEMRLPFVEDGQLRRLFVFERTDPQPDGWLSAEVIRAWFYLNDEEVLFVAADEGELFAPNRRPQSGEVQGNVRLALFRPADPYDFDETVETPVIEATTRSLGFDSALGKVWTDDRLVVRSERVDLAGRGMALTLNEESGQVTYFTLREREMIVIKSTGDDGESSSASIPRSPADPGAVAPRAARDATPDRSESSPVIDPTYYELKLLGETIITRGFDDDALRVAGENLIAQFSLDGGGFESLIGQDFGEPARPVAAANWRDLIIAAPFASVTKKQPGESTLFPTATDIVVAGSGPIEVRPIEGRPSELRGPDDLHATMTGSPLTIAARGVEAHGAQLDYSQSGREIELSPASGRPVTVALAEYGELRSYENLVYSMNDHRGGFAGVGVFNAWDETTRPSGERAPGADERIGDALPSGLIVNWTKSMSVVFKPGVSDDSMGPIDTVELRGDVRIDDPTGYSMRSDGLDIAFVEAAGRDEPVLESIHAFGALRAQGTEGSASCDDLIVSFELDADGDPVPSLLEASGSVRASDADKIVNCGLLTAWFSSPDRESSAAEDDLAIERFLAVNNVHLEAEGDFHAFGDRLSGDLTTELYSLDGDTVLVRKETFQVVTPGVIEVDRAAGRIHRPGSGVMTYLQASREDDPDQRARPADKDELRRQIEERLNRGGAFLTEPPAPDESPEPDAVADSSGAAIVVRVSWDESMTYVDELGVADVRGTVKAEASPAPNEYDTVEANRLVIELSGPIDAPNDEAPQLSAASDDDPSSWFKGSRRLRKLTALGEGDEPAVINAARYYDDERTEVELLISLRSNVIEYFDLTEKLDGYGDGKLLIMDRRAPDRIDSGEGPGLERAEPEVAFTGQGDTLFSWTGRLTLDGARNAAFMQDDVVMTHQPSGDAERVRLTCQELSADFETSGAGVDVLALSQRENMTLRAAIARGNVFVASGLREMEADRLVYSRDRMIALLEAYGDNRVVIDSGESMNPIEAGRVIWDLYENSVSVEEWAPLQIDR